MAIEIIIGVSNVIFGVAALLLASKARQRLTPGLIRQYIDSFSVCLSFIVIFSLWLLIRDVVSAKIGITHATEFPEYIFIALTYIAFIIGSYRVINISHTFGFKAEGEKIAKLLEKRKRP